MAPSAVPSGGISAPPRGRDRIALQADPAPVARGGDAEDGVEEAADARLSKKRPRGDRARRAGRALREVGRRPDAAAPERSTERGPAGAQQQDLARLEPPRQAEPPRRNAARLRRTGRRAPPRRAGPKRRRSPARGAKGRAARSRLRSARSPWPLPARRSRRVGQRLELRTEERHLERRRRPGSRPSGCPRRERPGPSRRPAERRPAAPEARRSLHRREERPASRHAKDRAAARGRSRCASRRVELARARVCAKRGTPIDRLEPRRGRPAAAAPAGSPSASKSRTAERPISRHPPGVSAG